MIKRIESILKARDAYAGVFYKIGEHVPYADLQAGIQAFGASGADIIVSVGGGSPIDASKAILYNLQKQEGGPTRKQIGIPTTLSAAEYTVRYAHVPRWKRRTDLVLGACGLH